MGRKTVWIIGARGEKCKKRRVKGRVFDIGAERLEHAGVPRPTPCNASRIQAPRAILPQPSEHSAVPPLIARYASFTAINDRVIDNMHNRMYSDNERYSWDEEKLQRTLAARGLDFADAPLVFAGPVFSFEDDREDYGEVRWVSLGLLRGKVVVLVHTTTESEIHIISMREASKNEQRIYARNIQ